MKRRSRKDKSAAVKSTGVDVEPTLVTKQDQLAPVLEQLSRARRFAFDTEFVMEDSYASEVCLIQAATDEMVALIDPLGGIDDTGFWELVADKRIEKVVHAGAEDLALCVQRTGKIPQNIFDLQVAAGLIGLGYPLSLLKLVRATSGARLYKSQTLTDWRRRPLTDAQTHYAVEDVVYLPTAHRHACQKLEKLGRMDWLREELARWEQPETYERTQLAQVTRLKGAGALDGQGLAIARKLMEVRDSLAKRFNRPARVLLKDYLIVEIARHKWTSATQIRGLRGLQLSNVAVRQLADAVKSGLDAPAESWPEVRTSPVDSAEESALISLATGLVRSYCHQHDIAHQLAATKQNIRDLVYSFTRGAPAEDSSLSTGWRGQTIGPMLNAFLSGEKRVSIRRSDKSIRVVLK